MVVGCARYRKMKKHPILTTTSRPMEMVLDDVPYGYDRYQKYSWMDRSIVASRVGLSIERAVTKCVSHGRRFSFGCWLVLSSFVNHSVIYFIITNVQYDWKVDGGSGDWNVLCRDWNEASVTKVCWQI